MMTRYGSPASIAAVATSVARLSANHPDRATIGGPPTQTVSALRRPLDATSPSRAPRVLIIEDDRAFAMAVERMLRVLGYDTSVTSVPEEAFDLAGQKPPDVVLAEIGIRRPIDTIAVAAQLRRCCGATVVFVSARTDSVTVAHAKHADPSAYLVKPARNDGIKIAIELALDQRDRELAARDLADGAGGCLGPRQPTPL